MSLEYEPSSEPLFPNRKQQRARGRTPLLRPTEGYPRGLISLIAIALNTCFWARVPACFCRANMAHMRQSNSDSGLGFQVNVLKTLQVVTSSLGSGPPAHTRHTHTRHMGDGVHLFMGMLSGSSGVGFGAAGGGLKWESRCRANMAHIRQSRPDSGLDFQVTALQIFKLFPHRSAAVSMHTPGTRIRCKQVRGYTSSWLWCVGVKG